MSKPIFIVRLPYNENLNLDHHSRYLEKQLPDYHPLVIVENNLERVEFECYNSPHTEIEFEELKSMVGKMLGDIYQYDKIN